jgi:hypothetical protein
LTKEYENPKFEIEAEVEAKVKKILSVNPGLNFDIWNSCGGQKWDL